MKEEREECQEGEASRIRQSKTGEKEMEKVKGIVCAYVPKFSRESEIERHTLTDR